MDAVRQRRSGKEKFKEVLKDNLLVLLLILAVGIGVGMGFGLRKVWSPYEARKIFYLGFPGQILLNMLKCLILPLIVSSLITGMAALDGRVSGKLGGAAVVYYMTTTLLAVVLGIILVLSIRPGYKGGGAIDRSGSSKKSNPLQSLLDLLRNCFPNNLIAACFQKGETSVITKTYINADNETISYEKPVIKSQSGSNILGLVVVSIAFGCVINHLGHRGKPLKMFFRSLNDATMVLTKLVIWYSPIGIMFLIATKFVEMEDPTKVFEQLLFYFLTVLAGLAIHGLILLPGIYFVATRKNPYLFMFRQLKAILTAWGTASSSATLPITVDCLVNRNKIHRCVVDFVAPVGATINMDGTALYEAVAAIFIAQFNGRDLSIAEVIIVSLTATAAAIGAAGIPQAGLVTMVIVLTAVDLPTNDVTLILAIDWFLDRFRTAINVLGDAYGAGILAHIFRETFSHIAENDEADYEDDDGRECVIKPYTNGDVKDVNAVKIYPSIKEGVDNHSYMDTKL